MEHHEFMSHLELYVTGNLNEVSDFEVVKDHIESCDECRKIFIDIKSYESLVQRYFELFSSKSPGLQAMLSSIDGLLEKGVKGKKFVKAFTEVMEEKVKKSLDESKGHYKKRDVSQAAERVKEAVELNPKDKDVSIWSTFLKRIYPRIVDDELKISLSSKGIENLVNAYETTMSVEIKDNEAKPKKEIAEIKLKTEDVFYRTMNRKIKRGKNLQEKRDILNQWARNTVAQLAKI